MKTVFIDQKWTIGKRQISNDLRTCRNRSRNGHASGRIRSSVTECVGSILNWIEIVVRIICISWRDVNRYSWKLESIRSGLLIRCGIY